MAALLLFLSAFAFFVSHLRPSIGPGDGGRWAALAAVLDPRSGPDHALTTILGNAATILFPFGSPAFRLNALAALLVAASAPLLLGFLRGAKDRDAPPSSLDALDRSRARDAGFFLAALLWLFSEPVRAAAAAWGPGAPALFLVFAFLWSLGFRPAGSLAGAILIRGFLGGLALAADPRHVWGILALLPFAFTHRFKDRRSWGTLLLALPAAFLGWGLADGVWAALQGATAHQALTIFWKALPDRAVGFLPAVGSLKPSGPLLRSALAPLPLTAWPLALWGAQSLWRRNRPLFESLGFFWLLTAFGPRFIGPPGVGAAALILPALPLLILTGMGAADLLESRPRWLPALLALLPLTLSVESVGGSRGDLSALDRGTNLLVSLPENAVLWNPSPATRSGWAYQTKVLGRRPDIRLWTPESPPVDLDPTDVVWQGLFAESEESLPTPDPADGWPEGLAVRYAPAGEWSGSSPVSLSLGRVPFFFFMPRSGGTAGADVGAAHARLARAFARHRVIDEAETEFLAALALNPDDGAAARDLGRLYRDADDGRRAAVLLARAVNHAPDDVAAAALEGERAEAEFAEGRTAQGLDALARGVARDGSNAGLRERLAEEWEKNARPSDAARQWAVLRDRYPTEKTYHWRLTQAWMMAREPVKAFGAVERYLGLPLAEDERRTAEEFRKRLAESAAQAAK
ncbi:MAG: hypothetical protein IPP68_08410 [Elusimicrobia bacterium]|nr:hypothetical protein [Elusimicrobiota bacterium]